MTLTISAGVASDTGRVRSLNEDSWCLQPRMYAVADGMGGHAAGERASQLAVEALARVSATGSFDTDAVHRGLAEANTAMITESSAAAGSGTGTGSEAGRPSMGTTVAGLAVVAMAGTDHWLAFNIGDSRVYQLERNGLLQISIDHSEVQELIDAGQLDPADAAQHPRRNVVTRSLGTAGAENADTWLLPMTADQVFLICSDGLTGELAESEIGALLGQPADPTTIATELVRRAVEAGGRDNVTALVVRTEADADPNEDTIPRRLRDFLADSPDGGQS